MTLTAAGLPRSAPACLVLRSNSRERNAQEKAARPPLGVAAAILIAAAPAAADPPLQQTATIVVNNPIKINQSCRPDGCDFDLLAGFTVTRRSTLFYDDAGALAKKIRHVDLEGTLYRSTNPSRTIPYAGHWQRTLDVAAGTVTITGLWALQPPRRQRPGHLAAGRQITDTCTGELLSASGRAPGAALQAVCATSPRNVSSPATPAPPMATPTVLTARHGGNQEPHPLSPSATQRSARDPTTEPARSSIRPSLRPPW